MTHSPGGRRRSGNRFGNAEI
ncbi:protein of unknown function [Methylocella tundrae]|uniref:Uncharacterized protein n=1 Tax=Methylocella tundrae TaxID=227605 RepID=A0A4U8Z0X5_METTU|nr:protein of unknown function [Methylocella tundrae]